MELVRGTVIRSTGSWYSVQLDDMDQEVNARIIGKFRLDGMKTTNPIAVGDCVWLEDTAGEWIIRKMEPRKNYIARQSPRKKHEMHLLASNVDQAVIIATILNPDLKLGFIDRFLLMTEPRDIPAIIVFNKADLYGEEELEIFYALKYIYEKIGYPCLLVSAYTRQHIEDLIDCLRNKTTLIAGQSGVGKSSLINAIQPGIGLRTGEISDYSGKGQHTTTFAERFRLDIGGYIIDTPGIKTLSFNNMEVMDVAHNFREFFEASQLCRFSNCTHRNEPHCAVKEQLESGQISGLRYQNYLQIIEEIEDQNYWERLDL